MPEVSRSLQPRHITMISIGSMIGAGLFISSSAAIAAPGPAVVFPWADYLALAGMVAVLLAMAMTPDVRRDFKTSVLSLAVAAYVVVVERRRNAGATRAALAAAQGEHP